ncbi:flavonoid 3'-monooxygenase CYP75B137-like [Zingiber officinale]|uniref:Cytochrome P450 n=1 Tax=Zingiber officinale TaxID=94328 RepID=A0A8J5I271_ZINOF|nr:flavonoid 3'-monooxygenase CYP75B137-like [Zingiber officinale]KAG6533859.1 hypothetical protein ZIOFF_007737 [Zingiber officinale]
MQGSNKVSIRSYLAISLLTLLCSVFLLRWLRWRSCGRGRPPLPPGPLGLPFLGSLLSLEPELHVYFRRLALTHGPVLSLRLGSKLHVVLSSPAAVREAFKDHDEALANHDPPACSADALRHNMVWCPHGPLWRSLRKVTVRELLSVSGIEAVSHLRCREVQQTVSGLRAGEPVAVRDLVFTTVFHVMTGMLWGVTPSDDAASQFRKVIQESIWMLSVPNVSDFFPKIAALDLQGLSRRMKELYERYTLLFAKFAEEKHGEGFLKVMMQVLEKDDKESFTLDNVKGLFLDLVMAGTDTSTSAVEWAMSELMCNPEAMKRVRNELDAVVGKGRLVEESDLPKLPYLCAVMKETLRLHPVIPLLVPHSPSSTFVLGGYTIPKGSKVFINVWAIHRDPALWEDPLQFRPERFLQGNQNYDFRGNTCIYLPFGLGRRICVAISLSQRMIIYMLASFLHCFDWELPEGHELELSGVFGIVLKKARPLVLIPRARNHQLDIRTLC